MARIAGLLAGAAMMAAAIWTPAAAQSGGGGGGGDPGASLGGPGADAVQLIPTVRLSIAPLGSRCFRIVSAAAFDSQLGQTLFRIPIGLEAYTSQGVAAFENALAGARTLDDARRGIAAGEADAAAYRRPSSTCGS